LALIRRPKIQNLVKLAFFRRTLQVQDAPITVNIEMEEHATGRLVKFEVSSPAGVEGCTNSSFMLIM